MKHTRLDDHGFAHYLILSVAVTVLALGGIFVVVYRAHTNHNTDANLNKSTSGANSQASLSFNTQPKSGVSTSPTTPTSTAKPTVSNSTPTPPHSTNPSTQASSKNSTPTPSQAPSSTNPTSTVTPFSVLTGIITDLDNGISCNITASPVSVPGPITTAVAQPIVFSANGQTYFAYTQGTEPDFSTTPTVTANSMAIVSATTTNPTLTSAYLDKGGFLVNPDQQAVGYSVGGD